MLLRFPVKSVRFYHSFAVFSVIDSSYFKMINRFFFPKIA